MTLYGILVYILFDIIWYPFWSLLFSRVEDKRRVGAIQADSFQKEQGRLPLLTINESGVGLIPGLEPAKRIFLG